jgi:hypothetical protein
MMSKAFFLALLALLASVARCEIVPLSLILDADATVVHYIKGKNVAVLVCLTARESGKELIGIVCLSLFRIFTRTCTH